MTQPLPAHLRDNPGDRAHASAPESPDLAWPVVLQDTCEPNPELDAPTALFWPMVYVRARKGVPGHAAGLPLERTNLETGDYSLPGQETLVSIERKTLGDLIGTLFGTGEDSNGNARPELLRFRAQLDRMRDMNRRGGYTRIVVEASLVDVYVHRYRSRRVLPVSVVNMMHSIDVDYGVPTIWAGNRDGAQLAVGTCLMRIAEQARGEGEAFVKAVERGCAAHLPWVTGEVRDRVAEQANGATT